MDPANLHSVSPTDVSAPGPVPSAPVLDVRVTDTRPLPRAFEGMRSQLLPEHIAKLRALDQSRATVVLKAQGRVSQSMALAEFVVDFAGESAEAMQTGGRMLAIINPNDGVLEQFFIGFIAPGEVRDRRDDAASTLLLSKLQALEAKLERQQQLTLLAGAGGGSLKDRLEELKLLRDIAGGNAQPAQAQPSMGELMKDMSAAFAAMGQGMGAGMKSVMEAGREIATVAVPEKSFAAEVKEVMAIPGVPDVAHRVVDRVLPPRATSVAPKAGQGSAPARANPLERVAS